MKKILVCMLLVTCLLLVSCHGKLLAPRSYDGSTWLSTEPLMWFTVDVIFEAETSNFKSPPVVSKGEFYYNGEVYDINVRYMDGECIFVDAEINGEQVCIFVINGYSSSEEYYKGNFEASSKDPLGLEGKYDTIELVRVYPEGKNEQ